MPEWHAVPSDVLVRDDLEPHRRRDYRIHRFQSHEETQGRFLFAVYIMWYTLGRTWIESLRIDYAHEFLGVRINVWVSMAVFVLGAVSFIVVQQMGKDTDLLAEKLRTVTEIEQRLENGESEDSSDSVVSFPEQTVDEIKPTMPKLSRIPTSSPASNNSKSITFHRIRAMTIQIAPSILSADFCNLERDLKAISNADLVHVDVMDHHSFRI